MSLSRPTAALVLAALSGACTTAAEERPGGDVEVVIEGSDALGDDRLIRAAADEFKAFREHGHRAADLDDAAWAMRQELFREGHAHATVEVRMEPSPDDVRRAVFVVDDGPRTWMGALEFRGNEAFPSRELARFFEYPAQGLFEGEDGRTYVQSRIDASVAKVRGFYRAQGYRDAEVGPAEVDWRKERSLADVTVPVVEGRRFMVAAVAVEGALGTVTAGEAAHAIAGFRGGPFEIRSGTDAAGAVLRLLFARGHLLATVEHEETVDEEAATATIALRAEAGPRIRIAAIDVSGHDRTRTGFILSESGLETGEILTQDLHDRAVDALYRTGLFSSVALRRNPREVGGDIVDADVEIVVEEIPARTLDLEVGWGSYELLRGAVRYRDRNLFGIGRDFEIEPFGSLRGYGADARLADGVLLGRDDVIYLEGGYEFRELPSFDSSTWRAEASVRHRFDPGTLLAGGWRFRSSDASEVSARLPVDIGTAEAFLVSGPFVRLDLDRRDNVLLPRDGWIAQGGLFWSAPEFGADLDFVELTGGASVYEEILDGVVLALGVRAATREVLGGAGSLPIQERYFLGGEDSVRSFYEAELGPVDADNDPIGGLSSFEAHAELRVRVIGDFHVAPFYDIGSVGRGSFEWDGPFGHALGLGLRYHLPIGPVRLDFGFNPGRTFANDQDWALHFSFGFSF